MSQEGLQTEWMPTAPTLLSSRLHTSLINDRSQGKSYFVSIFTGFCEAIHHPAMILRVLTMLRCLSKRGDTQANSEGLFKLQSQRSPCTRRNPAR
ncbi:hypothetical protein VTO42DRAFT_5162 [Malbranchea cinnamomea]